MAETRTPKQEEFFDIFICVREKHEKNIFRIATAEQWISQEAQHIAWNLMWMKYLNEYCICIREWRSLRAKPYTSMRIVNSSPAPFYVFKAVDYQLGFSPLILRFQQCRRCFCEERHFEEFTRRQKNCAEISSSEMKTSLVCQLTTDDTILRKTKTKRV